MYTQKWKMDMITETHNSKETYEIGFNMGKSAKAGDVYCLDGDLGVGKTVFTQGFAKGLGINEPINSPTFTIVQEYQRCLSGCCGEDPGVCPFEGKIWIAG